VTKEEVGAAKKKREKRGSSKKKKRGKLPFRHSRKKEKRERGTWTHARSNEGKAKGKPGSAQQKAIWKRTGSLQRTWLRKKEGTLKGKREEIAEMEPEEGSRDVVQLLGRRTAKLGLRGEPEERPATGFLHKRGRPLLVRDKDRSPSRHKFAVRPHNVWGRNYPFVSVQKGEHLPKKAEPTRHPMITWVGGGKGPMSDTYE